MKTVHDYNAIPEGGIVRLTAGLIFAVCLMTANVWAGSASAACAGAKKACEDARKATSDAKQKYDDFQPKINVAYAALLVAQMQFDQAFDAFAGCLGRLEGSEALGVNDNCDAEEKALTHARSHLDAADHEWIQEQRDAAEALDAFEKATKAQDAQCKAYLDCLQKNAKPKPKPKPATGSPRV